MNDEQDIRNDESSEEEDSNIIVLTDEDGTEVEFEFCASVEYEGTEYVVLLPVEDDDGEVVILEVKEDENDSEEVTYISVDDDNILDNVFKIFKEQTSDIYDFDD